MHPDWLKIEEMFKYAELQMKEVTVSPLVYKALENSKVELFGVTIRSSPLFPFETHWDACDIDTHQQIQVPSGEWIHGVIIPEMPPIDVEPISWEFAPEFNELHKYNRSLQSFLFSLYK